MGTRLERHDRYNFEVKLNYPLDLQRKRNTYRLTIYFFIPKSLKIRKTTYPREDFYNDLFSYIRFRIPKISLRQILDPGNRHSPLVLLRESIDALREKAPARDGEAESIYEFRLLGTILKAQIKTEADRLVESMNASDKAEVSEAVRNIKIFLEHEKKIDEELTAIGKALSSLSVSRELEETCRFTQEFASLNIQTALTAFLKAFKESGIKENKELAEEITASIEGHQRRRSLRGSRLVKKPDSTNEDFVYWEGILKKYFQSVLYLNTKDKDPKETALHVVYAAAAGIAMALSLALGLWIAGIFTNQQSLSFLLALVIAYMVKDRTKEIIRNYSNRLLRRFFPDRKFEILDSVKSETIGWVQDTVRYVSPPAVPEEVRKRRSQHDANIIEAKGKPEEILLYEKEVTLDTGTIRKLYARNRDINNIIRFNVRKIIQYADDPFYIEELWHPEAGKIKKIRCAKVYHLNLVLGLKNLSRKKAKDEFSKHVRVILNQKGIVRISDVP